MVDPNRATSEEVLRRLKAASYERMRNELKCSVELLLRDFDMDWSDLAPLLMTNIPKKDIVQDNLTLTQLNDIAHIFSTEIYIIFRPREPWIKT
jgi:hypothetical protein